MWSSCRIIVALWTAAVGRMAVRSIPYRVALLDATEQAFLAAVGVQHTATGWIAVQRDDGPIWTKVQLRVILVPTNAEVAAITIGAVRELVLTPERVKANSGAETSVCVQLLTE